MGNFKRRDAVAAGLLAFASYTSAQVASYCPKNDVCYKLNIPESTASSGTGDIFFQLSAPSSYQWVALGQGTSMSGSQIFVVYTSGDGNVTVSPRLGTGEQEPDFNSDAKVTLLEGSGVSNGTMVANVKCSSCNSWSGGSASFSEGKGNWIWAAKTSGGPKDTSDQSAGISEHSEKNSFQWTYDAAKGGNSVNPLLVDATSPGSTSSGSGSSSNSGVTAGSSDTDTSKTLVAHGAIGAIVFVILFPFGAIAIRLASFTGLVWVHAAFQGFAYLLYIVAFGLGIYIANQKDEISEYHPIIGIVVFALLFFQPILGLMHHTAFKKYQKRTLWSHAHLWLGRLVITLGIINGGLGFKLANDEDNNSAMIAYSVIAGVVWLVWVCAIVFGERRRKSALGRVPSKFSESSTTPRGAETSEMEGLPRQDGHNTPAK